MNCKNCQENIDDSAQFCPTCGAKVVTDKLTTKLIWRNFRDEFFGWDNKYFFTLKILLLNPEFIFREYLGGTRKKYMAPFAFLAIGTAIAMLVFNQFADRYLEMSQLMSDKQNQLIEEKMMDTESLERFEQQKIESSERNEQVQKSILKYFNIITFLLIPFYALIAFWVFGKPYNYGEHLAIACYIQGFLFISTLIAFLVSLITSPIVYYISLILSVAYYLYAYGRLYKHNFGQLFIKFLKFVGILLIIFLIFAAIIFVVQFIKLKTA